MKEIINHLSSSIQNELECRKEIMATVQRIVERIQSDAHQDFQVFKGRCDMDDIEALLSYARQVVKIDTTIVAYKTIENKLKTETE
tara:strand:+ start:302 stop:559 length:258 start_codon:yes stop_codon:yes gene_type:complete